MTKCSRLIMAFAVLLSGLALIPQLNLFAGTISWQRFVGGYEDEVTVTRARYEADDDELEVRATSSAGGAATLYVYRTSDDFFIGTLTFTGSDHRGTFTLSTDPEVISVRSSLGGTSTVIVTSDSTPPPTVTPNPDQREVLNFPLIFVNEGAVD